MAVPNYSELMIKGVKLANSQKWEEAIIAVQEAIALEPNNPNAFFQLGNILRLADRAEESLVYLKKARELAPTEAIVYNSLGLSLRAAARHDEAEASYLRALELNENFGEARYNLGKLHGELISYHRAEDIKMGMYQRTALQTKREIIFSNYSEQIIISDILSKLPSVEQFCVDVGASDGVTFSNSYPLFRDGWRGLAIEPSSKFVDLAYTLNDYSPQVSLLRAYATCENIVPILEAQNTPTNFGFLTLDIDSYDFYLTEAILKKFRPRLICVEINERIPPPINFALKPGGSPTLLASGASICKFESLLNAHSYAIVKLEYNNLFAVHISDLINLQANHKQLSGREAWIKGYWERSDRSIRFPWNKTLDYLASCPLDEAITQLKALMSDQMVFIELDVNADTAATARSAESESEPLSLQLKDILLEAQTHYKATRYPECLAVCQRAVRLHPNSSLAYKCLGATLGKLSRNIEALAALQQAAVLSRPTSRTRAPGWIENDEGNKLLDLGFNLSVEDSGFPALE